MLKSISHFWVVGLAWVIHNDAAVERCLSLFTELITVVDVMNSGTGFLSFEVKWIW